MLKKGLLILLCVCIVGLHPWLTPLIQRTASYLVFPVIYLQHKLIDPLKQCQPSSIVLQEAYEQLLSEYIKLQALIHFNDDTHELRSFRQRYTTDHVLAQVMQRYVGADEQYILIDKGAHHGIEEQMVLVYKDMLVGRVHQVFPFYSKCILITDQRCKVAAYCAQTKAQGITRGTNQPDCIELHHVSHLCALQQDDLLISSGEGLIFPRGFGIARITTFHKDGLMYTVLCKPLVDLTTLNYCYVVLGAC